METQEDWLINTFDDGFFHGAEGADFGYAVPRIGGTRASFLAPGKLTCQNFLEMSPS
jgi:hypothetical protein